MTLLTPNPEQHDAIERLSWAHGDCEISPGHIYTELGISFHVAYDDGFRCLIDEDGVIVRGSDPSP